MNRAERRWLLAFTLIVFLVTFIPCGLGFTNQNEDWVFTGFFIGVEDGNSYLAKMMRGWMGDWLFRSPYSSVEQAGLPALLPYVWLGKLTTPTNQHTQFLILFQALRLVGIGIAVWGTYRFASVFFKELHLRYWVVGLSLLGGGLGWLLAIIGQGDLLGSLPLDYISPEAFGFLSVYSLPHLAAARGLLLFGLAAYIRTPSESGTPDRDGLRAGLAWLALSLLQPLTVVVGGLVVAVHLGVTGVLAWRGVEGFGWPRWRGALQCALWLALPPLPVMLWTVITFARDPYAQAWTAQNILTTPHPLHYLLGFAIVLPYAALGLRPLWNSDRWRAALVFGWLAVVPLLIYIPIPVQRRLAEGVFAALAVVALATFQARPSWKPALLSPAFLTTLFLLLGGIFTTSGLPGTPVFRPAAEVRAFEVFREVIPTDSVVLASYDSSNAMPAWIPVRVVTGHGPESLGGREFRNIAESLMLGRMDPALIESFLTENRIDFIFWQTLGAHSGVWEPAGASYLELVATSEEYALYAVNP